MTLLRGARRVGLALVTAAAAQLPAGAAELNDYPTAARADYVFACMKTNGETRPALEKCSCSIDVIASILPYDRYVAAETFLSLSQVPGRFGTMFQSPEQARAATNDLRRAQAEGEVRCFDRAFLCGGSACAPRSCAPTAPAVAGELSEPRSLRCCELKASASGRKVGSDDILRTDSFASAQLDAPCSTQQL